VRIYRATPLYHTVEAYFDQVKGQWEEHFEGRYGFWRGFVDEQVRRYLDCGLFEKGFARVRRPDCCEEYLLAFSGKTGFVPEKGEVWEGSVSGVGAMQRSNKTPRSASPSTKSVWTRLFP
jgi:hypothetical protein